jgi:hypothetical protein
MSVFQLQYSPRTP